MILELYPKDKDPTHMLIPAYELFYLSTLCKSKGEARRLILQGGAYVNDRRVKEIDELVLVPISNKNEKEVY